MVGLTTLHRIRVFVSSPGDCSEERKVLDEVVERINRFESELSGLVLQLFRWEDDVVPRIGPSPQSVIDDQRPACDLYLGIMSSRFGGDDSRESGTEKEFRTALAAFRATGHRWMLFYFNLSPPVPTSVAESKQLTQVLEFRQELETLGLVGTYSGVRGHPQGFFEQVELHLRRLLQRPELTVTRGRSVAEHDHVSNLAAVARPTIPVEYLSWLQLTKCASVDLLGLNPKYESAAKLHSVYVPLTIAPRLEPWGDDVESLQKTKPLTGDNPRSRPTDTTPRSTGQRIALRVGSTRLG